MKKKLNINGQIIETKLFKTRKAAQSYMNKNEKRNLVYFRAHEYYVSIA